MEQAELKGSNEQRTMPELSYLIGNPADTLDECTAMIRFIGNAVPRLVDDTITEDDGRAVFVILNTVADLIQWASTEQSRKAAAASLEVGP